MAGGLAQNDRRLQFGLTVLLVQAACLLLFPGFSFANQGVGSTSTAQRSMAKEHRIALVIGNGAYGNEGKLVNPTNDAEDMTKALQELGFEVELLRNANKQQIDNAVKQFNQKLRQGSVGLFYYAGHGVEVNGENYLIPISAKIDQESDVEYEASPLGKIVKGMENSGSRVNIVLIDACRTNPYSRRWRRSIERGLASLESGKGTIISYATAPKQVAADGNSSSRNSPYTASLLQHIQTPDLDLELMLRKVRASVMEKTKERQMPWVQSSLMGEVMLKSTQPFAMQQPQPSAPLSAMAEDLFSSGQQKQKDGRHRGAIADYGQAIKLKPDYAAPYFGRGRSFASVKDYQSAITDFSNVIKLEPDFIPAYYEGREVYDELDYKTREKFEPEWSSSHKTVMKIKHNDAYMYAIQVDVSKQSDAESDWDTKKRVQVLELAENLARSDNFSEQTRALIPDYLAETYFMIGEHYDDMPMDLNTKGGLLTMPDENNLVFKNFREKMIKKALESFDRAIDIQPKNSKYYYTRAQARYYNGDKNGAIKDIGYSIQNDASFRAYELRARIYESLGKHKEARDDLDQALMIDAKDVESYLKRGKLNSILGNLQQAALDFDQAVRLPEKYNSARTFSYFNRAEIYQDLGNLAGAIADYSYVIKGEEFGSPHSVAAYRGRGACRKSLGDLKGAIEDFTMAIKMRPEHGYLYYMRGITYAELAQPNENLDNAINDLQKSATLYLEDGDLKSYQAVITELKEVQNKKPR